MSTILYSFKCPVAGCTQVVTIESNDETDALNRLVPAVQEHVTSAHAGVPVPGNVEDLVRTGMYQGGAETPAAADPSQPGIPAGVTTPTETSAVSLPATDTSTPEASMPAANANPVGATPSDSGTYAPNPSIETPAETAMPTANSVAEPMASETQPGIPAETPAETVPAAPTEENQNNQ